MLLAVGVSVGEPVCDRLPLFLFLDRQHGKVRRDQTTDAEPSGQAKNRGCQQGQTTLGNGVESGDPCDHHGKQPANN